MNYDQTYFLNNDFRTCLYRLINHGYSANPRGAATKELLNYNITLTDPRNRVITFPDRKTSTRYLLGEFIWYLSGSADPKGILPYAKFWEGIRNSGEQIDYHKGTVNSNYGARIFGRSNLPSFLLQTTSVTASHHSVNQWESTKTLLLKDKDSRQAIMNIHLPSDRHDGNKDVPCTLSLQWIIREERLHLIVNMRSNDVILGFTNDVFQFTMLQEAMLLQLRAAYPDLQLGHYYHNAGSMHIYERHFDMAERIINTKNAYDLSMIPMDRFDEEIISALISVEQEWQLAGATSEFDFAQVEAFNNLTPYWQNLMQAFFADDDAAMHAIFGQKED